MEIIICFRRAWNCPKYQLYLFTDNAPWTETGVPADYKAPGDLGARVHLGQFQRSGRFFSCFLVFLHIGMEVNTDFAGARAQDDPEGFTPLSWLFGICRRATVRLVSLNTTRVTVITPLAKFDPRDFYH